MKPKRTDFPDHWVEEFPTCTVIHPKVSDEERERVERQVLTILCEAGEDARKATEKARAARG